MERVNKNFVIREKNWNFINCFETRQEMEEFINDENQYDFWDLKEWFNIFLEMTYREWKKLFLKRINKTKNFN